LVVLVGLGASSLLESLRTLSAASSDRGAILKERYLDACHVLFCESLGRDLKARSATCDTKGSSCSALSPLCAHLIMVRTQNT
jgi:hypothetical protein